MRIPQKLQILQLTTVFFFLQILKLFCKFCKSVFAESKSHWGSSLLPLTAHPGRHGLSHALLEGGAEGAVAPEAALAGQLLRGEGTLVGNGFIIEIDKMADAQPVDVGVVGQTLLGEILAEIVVVGAHSFRKLKKGKVVAQVNLGIHTMLLQQLSDVGGNDRWRSSWSCRLFYRVPLLC